MKNKEIIEKAAEKFYPPKTTDLICSPKLVRDSFIAGAKWQQEQIKNMYSEEEVRKMFSKYNEVIAHRDIEEWQAWIDKQFKK
jgi:hypothetical protein